MACECVIFKVNLLHFAIVYWSYKANHQIYIVLCCIIVAEIVWQGIQFIVDDSGGFSGVAASLLENIEDEYTNVPVLLYSVRSPGSYTNIANRKQVISRNLHDAVSFSALSSLCKLIVPLGLPSLSESKLFC